MTDFTNAFLAAKEHARACFPEESCGFVVDGAYVPVDNKADDPAAHDSSNPTCGCRLCSFEISQDDTLAYLSRCEMILHSHPNGPQYPSLEDMRGQVATNVPWGIIMINDERVGDPEVWGAGLPVPDILGRTFLHGVRDCYSLIRDTFLLGKDELKRMGVSDDWPFPPVDIGDAPRADGWWNTQEDFYGAGAFARGWHQVNMDEVRTGDCFLTSIRIKDKFNHAGVLVSNDMILHHLPDRLSRREPSGIWARAAGRWLRYDGVSRA